jgi:hypothetical protein
VVADTRIGEMAARHAQAYAPFAPWTGGSPVVSSVQYVDCRSHPLVEPWVQTCRVGLGVGPAVGISYVVYLGWAWAKDVTRQPRAPDGHHQRSEGESRSLGGWVSGWGTLTALGPRIVLWTGHKSAIRNKHSRPPLSR